MTHITFYKSSDVFYGFKEEGHTGFADEGSDILCSAISAMTMLVINTIEVGYTSSVDYTIAEDSTTVELIARGALMAYEKDDKKRYAVAGLMMSYYHQLRELQEEYYDFLSVEVIEKKCE